MLLICGKIVESRFWNFRLAVAVRASSRAVSVTDGEMQAFSPELRQSLKLE
jgi:hypothetical protein